METSIYLLMSIIIFVSAIGLLNLPNYREEDGLDNSELHARNRYAFADKIRKEFEERNHHHL